MIDLPFESCNHASVVPERAYPGDAGYDLHSVENVSLRPFQRALIHTGLKIAIPEGFAGFVVPRSGLALKQGLSLVNAPGLIDSNYRGELGVIAINLDPENTLEIAEGDRVAQLVIMRVEDVRFCQTEALDASERGEGGFGSSGVASR